MKKDNKKKQQGLWAILLGATPLVITIVFGIYGAIAGINPTPKLSNEKAYGLEGFRYGAESFTSLFWPLLIVGVGLIFLGIYVNITSNKKK